MGKNAKNDLGVIFMQYFAGANTRYGFKSIFEERFNNIERIFILKGSSGCGKSTMMRRIAERAQVLGIDTDLIYCSSDIESLDGVVIPSLGVAIADGTSPHILEVKYPCVKESIINLGRFWNEKKLIPKRNEIIYLTDKKGMHYKNAYRCLSAVGEMQDIRKSLISKCVERDKVEKSVLKLLQNIADERRGNTEVVFASAFTSAGIKTLPVFESAKTLYRVSGKGSDIFMKAVFKTANELSFSKILSFNPISPEIVDMLYFPESGILVSSLEASPCASFGSEKSINTNKFIDDDSLSVCKMKLRGIDRLISEISAEAQKELSDAKAVHNAIESIYIPSMDFAAMDEFTESLSRKIFSE